MRFIRNMEKSPEEVKEKSRRTAQGEESLLQIPLPHFFFDAL
jgi:hypothetical protein